MKEGGRGRKKTADKPPPRSFTRPIFRAVFDSRSSFLAPKLHGNACYATLGARDFSSAVSGFGVCL